MIRDVVSSDADAILEIYRPHVESTAVSFETEMPSLEEVRSRILETTVKFPWIVYEEEGRVIGYAYANTFRARLAYRWSVEATVYIAHGFSGRGIGKKLYAELFARLKKQNVVNVIGGITLPNEGSVALHEAMGFVKVAHLKDIGFKFSRWWDVGYWQLQLEKPAIPEELTPPP